MGGKDDKNETLVNRGIFMGEERSRELDFSTAAHQEALLSSVHYIKKMRLLIDRNPELQDIAGEGKEQNEICAGVLIIPECLLVIFICFSKPKKDLQCKTKWIYTLLN